MLDVITMCISWCYDPSPAKQLSQLVCDWQKLNIQLQKKGSKGQENQLTLMRQALKSTCNVCFFFYHSDIPESWQHVSTFSPCTKIKPTSSGDTIWSSVQLAIMIFHFRFKHPIISSNQTDQKHEQFDKHECDKKFLKWTETNFGGYSCCRWCA